MKNLRAWQAARKKHKFRIFSYGQLKDESLKSRTHLIARAACSKSNWLRQGQVSHIHRWVTVAFLSPDNVLTIISSKRSSKLLLLLLLHSSPQPFIRFRHHCGKCSTGNIKGNHNSFILDLQWEKHQEEESSAVVCSPAVRGKTRGKLP